MSLNSVKMLGISVTTNPKKEILEYIEKYLRFQKEKPLIIVTPNPEQVVLAQQNKRFAKIINWADISLPDGVGIASILRIRRISGIEFMIDLAELAANQGYRVGLIGGFGGVALKALERLQKKHPKLLGWGDERTDVATIAEKIKRNNTRIVFVGLGAPKQEIFIERLVNSIQHLEISKSYQPKAINFPIVLMSVGGSFDILSGRIPRAPLLIRLIGFEWAWRLFREPWRWRRQLALLKFVWLALKERLSELSKKG